MSDTPNAHEELESAESAIHAALSGKAAIPLSIAIMAVIAAVLGGVETTAASEAVLARSDAAIRQGEVTDRWSYFQSESTKKNMYQLAADQGGPAQSDLKEKAAGYAREQEKLKVDALAKEEEVRQKERESDMAMARHHRLTISTSIVHLAIALASISIMVRRQWLWFGSLLCTTAGVIVALV